MLTIRRAEPGDLPACARLAGLALEKARAHSDALPPVEPDRLFALLCGLRKCGSFYVALDGEAPAGYLAFLTPFAGAFGRCRGVFSPLGGSAFLPGLEDRAFEALFTRAAGDLTLQGVSSFAVARYAHEEAAQRALVLNGFGARCCDLMRRAEAPLSAPDPSLLLRRAAPEELPAVAALEDALGAHLGGSPVFMPHPPVTPQTFAGEVAREGLEVYAAFDGARPVAYLSIGGGGETFLDDAPFSRHIHGAYCLPALRGAGLMDALLARALSALRAGGTRFLGVDCETLNPPAFRFWRKRFTPYCISYVRRVDERAVDVPRPS